MRKYNTIIFDLDGTLLNTLEDLAAAVNYALVQCGQPVRNLDEVRTFVGNGIRNLIIRAVPQGEENPKFEEVFAVFKEYYGAHCNDKTCLYRGVRNLLVQLKEEGCRLAIVSNKADFAVKELQKIYFDGLIEVAIGEKEGILRKPAPDTVNQALRELDSVRKEAVYVGDSEVDIATAQNAGIPCVSVTWGFRDREFLREHGAKVFADTAEDLSRCLQEMDNSLS